jgi:membrane protease YdiL (CAAX protease family)
MTRPTTRAGTVRYVAESVFIVAMVFLVSLMGAKLFWLIKGIADHVAPMQVTVAFPVKFIHPSVKLPLVKTQLPPSGLFTAVTCDYAKQLSQKEREYFDKKTEAADIILRCTFLAKPNYYEIDRSDGSKYLPEPVYTFLHVLPEITQKPLQQQSFDTYILDTLYYLPYTKIPMLTAINWATTLVKLFCSLALMVYMGYRFNEEKQKIKLGLKNIWVLLLVSSAPLMLMSIELWAHRNLGSFELPSFNLVAPVTSHVLETLLNSFAEEALYRGWMIPVLMLRFKPGWCVLISSSIFTYVHNYSALASIFVFISGMCWAIIWLKTRSVVLCFIPHALHNMIVILIEQLKDAYQ